MTTSNADAAPDHISPDRTPADETLHLEPKELIARFTHFATFLHGVHRYDRDLVLRAFRESGLPRQDVPPERRGETDEKSVRRASQVPWDEFRIALPDTEDADGFVTTLRRAMSRVLGRTAGSGKHWEAGAAEVHLRRSRGSLHLRLIPHLSYTQLRDAAKDWLDGAELRPWLAEHDLACPDLVPGDGVLKGPSSLPFHLKVQESDDRINASLFLPPSAGPPGRLAAKDDDWWERTLDYMVEGLPYSNVRGQWYRGPREVSLRRMRSRTRAIMFRHAPRTTRGSRTGIPDLPVLADPDPADAATLLLSARHQIGREWTAAASALAAAGVAGFVPPHRKGDIVEILDHRGHPMQLALRDERVFEIAVACAGISTSPEEVEAAFRPHLGEVAERIPGSDVWHTGPFQVSASLTSKYQVHKQDPRTASVSLRAEKYTTLVP